MIRYKWLYVINIFLLTTCIYALAEISTVFSPVDEKIIEKPIRAELRLKIGSDKPNEDFYGPPSFAVGKNGRIYILDSGNSRILCFSPEGNLLFSFRDRKSVV